MKVEGYISMTEIKKLIEQNKLLKEENLTLKKSLKEAKNWTRIKEIHISPKLNSMGVPRHMHAYFTTSIAGITKMLIGISSLTKIDNTNYEIAKEIAISIVDAITKFDYRKE